LREHAAATPPRLNANRRTVTRIRPVATGSYDAMRGAVCASRGQDTRMGVSSSPARTFFEPILEKVIDRFEDVANGFKSGILIEHL